jgi:type III secretory pathway component EscS
VVALLQSVTRIEERGLPTAARWLAALVALGVASPWIGAEMVRFTTAVLEAVPSLGRS